MRKLIAWIIEFFKSLFDYPTSPSSNKISSQSPLSSIPKPTVAPTMTPKVDAPVQPSVDMPVIAPEYGLRTLLTKPEALFYRTLLRAVDDGYGVFAKVRMGDVLYLANEPTNAKFHNNNILCKHFDFVLYDRQFYKPLLVIELDDKSHQRPENIERDKIKDSICAMAQLPVLRIAWNNTALRSDDLRNLITEKLASPSSLTYADASDDIPFHD